GRTVSIEGHSVPTRRSSDLNGIAGFDYTVTDNGTTNGASDPKSDIGHASFNITEVNDPPVAVDDSLAAVAEDSGMRVITFAELVCNEDKVNSNNVGQTHGIT